MKENQTLIERKERKLNEVRRMMDRLKNSDLSPENMLRLRIVLDKAIWVTLKAESIPQPKIKAVLKEFDGDTTLDQV